MESAISHPAVLTFLLGAVPRSGSPPWDHHPWVPRIQAIDLRSLATVVILVEELPAMANPDTAVILKLQAVATRNLKTIPTMLNTIRANTPSKPVPERQCPLSDTLTFLTEQDDEEHDQLHLRLPGLISRYSSPRQLAAFLTIVLMFRLSVPHNVSVFLACSRFPLLTYFLFHMRLEL